MTRSNNNNTRLYYSRCRNERINVPHLDHWDIDDTFKYVYHQFEATKSETETVHHEHFVSFTTLTLSADLQKIYGILEVGNDGVRFDHDKSLIIIRSCQP